MMQRVLATVVLWSLTAACSVEGPSASPSDESLSDEFRRHDRRGARHRHDRGHDHRKHRFCPRGSRLIVGTEGADTLVGTRRADCILGLGGDDRILGNAGSDVIFGGDGNDVIEAGPGRDVVRGGDGNDEIAGEAGADRLAGGDGNDILLGGGAFDRILGGGGNDVLLGGAGFDFLLGGSGDDAISDDADGAEILGGDGIDFCAGTDCERPPSNVETGCDPLPPGETCTSFPCCTALGVRISCEEDADCNDAEVCTTDTCQPAVGCFYSVDPGCTECPIAWQPSAMTPVFYGERDYTVDDGAPGPVRVFFPSLDGSPSYAPILLGCGRYPVVLFAHGNCSEDAEHYKSWFTVPASLARSGYVVVVPDLPSTRIGVGPWTDPHSDLAIIDAMLTWIRTSWDYSGSLLPSSIGIAGHSYGSLLAARFAQESVGTENQISAYASLSGVWSEWPSSPPRPISSLAIPKLFVWGTGFGDTFANLDSGGLWATVPSPKHRAAVADAEHFDYLGSSESACAGESGPCEWAGTLAREMTFTFFSKYMPPENWASLGTSLPDTMLLPPLMPTGFDQEFFMGLHRIAQGLFGGDLECSATLAWQATTSGVSLVP
jgi:hypothetical protein